MIDRVVEGARMIAPPVLSAAVSLALAPLIDAEPRPAFVLGVADPAVWIGAAGGVLTVSTGDAVRLPNGVVVAERAADRPFGEILPGEEVMVGGGAIVFASLRIEAVRWFDSRPALPASTAAAVSRVAASLEGVAVRPMADHGFLEALIQDDDGAALEAARLLIGFGDGLTPSGDDLIAGTIAAMLLIGGSLGAATAVAMVGRLESPLLDHAAAATTSLSASLLGHAFRGEVAAPAGALLAALAGRGDPATAVAALNAVGHSSGPALAAGVLAGTRAAIERSR
ncbi:MAG: DUF2877 domain-containing protein [Actinomycetota bacterium]